MTAEKPVTEMGRGFFDGGLKNFIYKGTHGRWRDVLSAPEIERYERAARENLTADRAHWLATGESFTPRRGKA